MLYSNVIAKSQAYLQINMHITLQAGCSMQASMLYLVETEMDEKEDDGKSPIFLTLQRHSPISKAIN